MIFSIGNHIQQIINGVKTQTRRPINSWYPRYKIGKYYSVTPGRGKKSIPEGKIKIISVKLEYRGTQISESDAIAEGKYTPTEFEELYKIIYPNWQRRWAYVFQFVPYQSSLGKVKKR